MTPWVFGERAVTPWGFGERAEGAVEHVVMTCGRCTGRAGKLVYALVYEQPGNGPVVRWLSAARLVGAGERARRDMAFPLAVAGQLRFGEVLRWGPTCGTHGMLDMVGVGEPPRRLSVLREVERLTVVAQTTGSRQVLRLDPVPMSTVHALQRTQIEIAL